MAKYLKNIKSFSQLKNDYKELLKKNHPDNGGDVEVMQEINCEYDALYKIWKDKEIDTLSEEEKKETASESRRHFYTQNGWAGSRYDRDMTLKEISKIVKNYTKEKYPTCKFSVRTHYASMCQSLTVKLLEFPEKMYKTGDDLRNEGLNKHVVTISYDGNPLEYDEYTDEVREMLTKLQRNDKFNLDSWYDEDLIKAYEEAIKDSQKYFYGIKTEYFKSVIDDVDNFVKSYNYEDCDGMIDYFDVNFWYHGCEYSHCQYVPKTARIKKQSNSVKTTKAKETSENMSDISYTIEKSKHTKTGETIYLVKPTEMMERETFNEEKERMKENGGYYSRFTHSFIFKEYPDFLNGTEVIEQKGD